MTISQDRLNRLAQLRAAHIALDNDLNLLDRERAEQYELLAEQYDAFVGCISVNGDLCRQKANYYYGLAAEPTLDSEIAERLDHIANTMPFDPAIKDIADALGLRYGQFKAHAEAILPDHIETAINDLLARK
jgi:hypothetical protein